VFSAVDVSTIYEVPLLFYEEKLDEKIAEKLGIWTAQPDLTPWRSMVELLKNPKQKVKIAIVGKYTDWHDTYKSLNEALVHGGVANQVGIEPVYIDSTEFEGSNERKIMEVLKSVGGILVPGGFGERGIEGKIKAVEFARTHKIPFFGICLGLQMAVIEYARNVCGMKHANSTEFCPDGRENVIDLMDSQKSVKDMGGTMRLGAYACTIVEKIKGRTTFAYSAYQKKEILERHRHRFEVSNTFRSVLEEKGLQFTGLYRDSKTGIELVEMVELADHPWFLGCQFHPEFLTKPLQAHPLFSAFIGAAIQRSSK
jgi:CTP synthase